MPALHLSIYDRRIASERVSDAITVRLLGAFEVSVGDTTVTDFRYAKVRALLALLCRTPGRPTRSWLAGMLWPDHDEARARSSLSQALTTLRRVLGERDRELPLVGSDATHVWLDRSPEARSGTAAGAETRTWTDIQIDLDRFDALLDASDDHPHRSWRTCSECCERLATALGLRRGELLADVTVTDSDLFERWVDDQRRSVRQRSATAARRLADRASWTGDRAGAVAWARRLVDIDPLVEPNQRLLVRLLHASGDTAAAHAQLAAAQQLLTEHLAVAPEAATVALADELERPPPAPDEPVYLVPAPASSLVGRVNDVADVVALLAGPTRLVTIGGTAGVGKTRLALAVAEAQRYAHEDGVVFVDLSAVDRADQVGAEIAEALGVGEGGHPSVGDAVLARLAGSHCLLVLDNLEQLLDAVPFVAELVARSPVLRVLATSRVGLGISGERQFVLDPLPVADAVELFTTRARDAGARPADGPAELADCAEICRRVDRLPLAVELLAARARGRSPAALLSELEHPLGSLEPERADRPARHRTLRRAIGWSVELLDPPSRRLFHRLSVFAGGWTADAAATIAPDIDDVEGCIDRLIGASMIRSVAGDDAVVGSDDRWTMLLTFREFAAEQFADDPMAPTVRRWHGEWCAAFAAAARDGLLSGDARRWMARIAAERDNLRVGFAHALQVGHRTLALRIAAGVWRFHWMSGLVREPLDDLLTALADRRMVPLDVQSDALRAAGTLAVGLGNLALAGELLEAAVAVARQTGDAGMVQHALTNLGHARSEQGELGVASVLLTESLDLAGKIDRRRTKFPLGMLSGIQARLGDFDGASALAAAGLRINREYGDPEGTADAMRTLGVAVRGLGDRTRAVELARQALAGHEELEHRHGESLDLVLLGDLAADAGDRSTAAEHYRDSLRRGGGLANPVQAGRVLERLAAVVIDDAPELAAELLGAAAAGREQAPARLAPGEERQRTDIERRCRVALGAGPYAAAVTSGQARTVAAAIELALSASGER